MRPEAWMLTMQIINKFTKHPLSAIGAFRSTEFFTVVGREGGTIFQYLAHACARIKTSNGRFPRPPGGVSQQPYCNMISALISKCAGVDNHLPSLMWQPTSFRRFHRLTEYPLFSEQSVLLTHGTKPGNLTMRYFKKSPRNLAYHGYVRKIVEAEALTFSFGADVLIW